ncbi:hypothetical protein CCHR01_18073 [Colletotrichum chrysophilum]|uniref:Uncharacterized protein n=1 Tax=Colletotrichum chrysophilum TaxID=1836956 RepID=A0AAD9A0S7_9PEZI|nr:hypothetical protein CCHR01_18073 [Colletotrichum chrysophilum]
MDDFPIDDQSLVPSFGDRSPAQWPTNSVGPPQHSYLFASKPHGFPSQHDIDQQEDFFHHGEMSQAFDITGLDLTGDDLLHNHINRIPIDQLVDPALLNSYGTGKHDQVTFDPFQDGQYQSTISTARVPRDGASTPASNPAWTNRSSRLANRDFRFRALPKETPTKRPTKECRRPASGRRENVYIEDIDDGERNGWEWGLDPSERAQEEPCNNDDFGSGRFFNPPHTHNRVSVDDAVVAAGDLLDFFGQPQTDGMIASNDLEAIVRIWSQARRMQ